MLNICSLADLHFKETTPKPVKPNKHRESVLTRWKLQTSIFRPTIFTLFKNKQTEQKFPYIFSAVNSYSLLQVSGSVSAMEAFDDLGDRALCDSAIN